jgi:hypothetical protein
VPVSREMSLTISRRRAISVAASILWTAIRAYLDGSRTVTFFMGDDAP